MLEEKIKKKAELSLFFLVWPSSISSVDSSSSTIECSECGLKLIMKVHKSSTYEVVFYFAEAGLTCLLLSQPDLDAISLHVYSLDKSRQLARLISHVGKSLRASCVVNILSVSENFLQNML